MRLQIPGRLALILGWAFLAIACWAGAQLSRMVEHSLSDGRALWIPAGIGLGTMLLKGYRVWPGIAVGVFAAGLPVYGSWVIALVIAAGAVFQACCGVWLIRRTVADHDPMGRTRDTALFPVVRRVAGDHDQRCPGHDDSVFDRSSLLGDVPDGLAAMVAG